MLIKVYIGAGNGIPSTTQESYLAALGGFTRTVGYGGWMDDETGVQQEEPSVMYEVVVAGNKTLPPEVRAFVESVKTSLGQQKVLVTTVPTQQELLL